MGETKDYKEERFDSYLNKIIIYSSNKFYRKQVTVSTKEKVIVDDDDYASFIQDFLMINSAFSAVDDIVNNIELNNALKSLSAIEQSVIFLLFKEELSQDEASQILNICSKSVSRIKLRALNKLKKFMEGDSKNEK